MRITNPQKGLLCRLADELFPVKDWISDVKRPYIPLDSPWRGPDGTVVGNPSINDLDVIGRIAQWLAADEADAAIANRWRQVAEQPLGFQENIPGRRKWRRERQTLDGSPTLETDARKVIFGAVASDNFILFEDRHVPDGSGTQRVPLTRGEFYGECLPAFERLLTERPPLDAAGWKQVVLEMAEDQAVLASFWLAEAPKSSEFIRQVCKDIAHAAMSFEEQIPEKFRAAMAIEAGEFRRPGNAYSEDDAARAVTELKKLLTP
jgi:hypothetical protein